MSKIKSIFATNPSLAEYQFIDKIELGKLFNIQINELDPLINAGIIQKRERQSKYSDKSRDIYPIKPVLELWNKIFNDPNYPNNFHEESHRNILLRIWGNNLVQRKLYNQYFENQLIKSI